MMLGHEPAQFPIRFRQQQMTIEDEPETPYRIRKSKKKNIAARKIHWGE